MIEPPAWVIPEGWLPDNLARCRSCDAQVMWCVTPKGKRAPIDRDGVNHFATCPQASSWRRRS
jgi:hypothetical protein